MLLHSWGAICPSQTCVHHKNDDSGAPFPHHDAVTTVLLRVRRTITALLHPQPTSLSRLVPIPLTFHTFPLPVRRCLIWPLSLPPEDRAAWGNGNMTELHIGPDQNPQISILSSPLGDPVISAITIVTAAAHSAGPMRLFYLLIH